jgi:hypothetical protein
MLNRGPRDFHGARHCCGELPAIVSEISGKVKPHLQDFLATIACVPRQLARCPVEKATQDMGVLRGCPAAASL